MSTLRSCCLLAGYFLATTLSAQEAVTVPSGSRDSPVVANQTAAPNRGIEFPVAFTTEVLGNVSGGSSRTAIFESLLNAGVALDLEKLLGWKGASASVRAIYPEGNGLTQVSVHDFNTLSNIDSYDSVRLYDAWLQLESGPFSLRAGQLLADAEFFNSDYATLFLNSSFGAIPSISQNFAAPIFPIAAPGVRLRVSPNDSFYTEVACFSGDVGGADTNNKHNTRLSFRSVDGVLIFAEIGYTLNPLAREPPADALRGLRRTYKLGGDYDSKRFEDTSILRDHHGNFSLYAITDQELWHTGDDTGATLSGFVRIGFAPDDRNTVNWYGDLGWNYKGLLPQRPQDILGAAFSYAQLSADLGDEEVLELTYQAICSRWLTVQPDLQFIFHPGASHSATTAIVLGVRCNVAF